MLIFYRNLWDQRSKVRGHSSRSVRSGNSHLAWGCPGAQRPPWSGCRRACQLASRPPLWQTASSSPAQPSGEHTLLWGEERRGEERRGDGRGREGKRGAERRWEGMRGEERRGKERKGEERRWEGKRGEERRGKEIIHFNSIQLQTHRHLHYKWRKCIVIHVQCALTLL